MTLEDYITTFDGNDKLVEMWARFSDESPTEFRYWKKIFKKNFNEPCSIFRKRFGDDEYLSEQNRTIVDCIRKGKLYLEQQ